MDNTNIEKFELHYFFNDDSHSIDAVVRHKCETEILALIGEIAQYLKVDLEIEVEPYGEGGFVDRYKIKWGKLSEGEKLASIIGMIGIVVSIVMYKNPVSTSTPEMQKVNDEIAIRTLARMRRDDSIQKIIDTKVQDSIATLNIKKLTETKEEENKPKDNLPIKKDDLVIHNFSSSLIDVTNSLQEFELSKALTELEINPKINRFRSNFFKNVRKSEKIISVSATPLNDTNKPLNEPVTILRENFLQYIIESDELPNEIDDNAFIEIISPVLIKGKYKWKGFYKGQTIEFYMKDMTFKQSVLNKQISFKSGICIECQLELKKKVNELGDINIISYSVIAVNGYTEGSVRTQIYRKPKKSTDNNSLSQADLFAGMDDEDYDD